MKVFSVIVLVCYFGNSLVAGKPEVPATATATAASAPYPPRGWRPSGPSFELPNETSQPSNEYGPASPESNVEVTEEEVEYTGEIGTTEASTRSNTYGPPSASGPGDAGTTTLPEDDLSVQGLPSSEPAKEFRTLPARLRNQRIRVQQTSARLQTRPGSQQFIQGTQFQQNRANTRFTGFSGNFRAAPQRANQFNQGVFTQQFAAPVQTFGVRAQPVFSQRLRSQKQQEAPVDSYGAPATTYGAPQNEYGSPELVEQQQPGIDEPEPDAPAPPTGNEDTTEANDVEVEENGGPAVAVSNSLATGRYILVQQQNPKTQKLRIIQAGAAKIRAQPVMQPIYTLDQFGQLVRVL